MSFRYIIASSLQIAKTVDVLRRGDPTPHGDWISLRDALIRFQKNDHPTPLIGQEEVEAFVNWLPDRTFVWATPTEDLGLGHEDLKTKGAYALAPIAKVEPPKPDKPFVRPPSPYIRKKLENMIKVQYGIYTVRTQSGWNKALRDFWNGNPEPHQMPKNYPTKYPCLITLSVMVNGHCHDVIDAHIVPFNRLQQIIDISEGKYVG